MLVQLKLRENFVSQALQTCLIAACLCALVGAPASASTILFSNVVQPGNLYGPDGVGIGHTPAFPNPGDYLTYAVPFTTSVTAALSAFELPIAVVSGPDQLQAFLMSDSAGAPGSIMESYLLSNVPGPPAGLFTITSVLDPVLIAGQHYWLAVTGPQTFAVWSLTLFQGNSSDGGASRTVINAITQPWNVGPGGRTGALEVLGNPVPEPEPGYTAIIGAILLFGVERLRRSKR